MRQARLGLAAGGDEGGLFDGCVPMHVRLHVAGEGGVAEERVPAGIPDRDHLVVVVVVASDDGLGCVGGPQDRPADGLDRLRLRQLRKTGTFAPRMSPPHSNSTACEGIDKIASSAQLKKTAMSLRPDG